MKKSIIFILCLLLYAFSSEAGPALPARLGSAVLVDGVKLTSSASGFLFKVTCKDGKDFYPPAEDKDGLNKKGIYIIDIPIYDPASQPEGAKPGSTGVIHVFREGAELRVAEPYLGEFTIGKGGTITHLDLFILSKGDGSRKKN